jgi:hypothetical protein
LAETGDAEHAIAVARLRLEHGERSVLNEFYRVAFREKVYCSIDVLQADLDVWIREYNEQKATSRAMVLRQNAYADLP